MDKNLNNESGSASPVDAIVIGTRVKINKDPNLPSDFHEGVVTDCKKGDLYNVQSDDGSDAWYLEEELEIIDQ